MNSSYLQLASYACAALILTSCISNKAPLDNRVTDACLEPDYERPENLYEAQIDFMLRAYYPVNYLDDRHREELLDSIADIQARDAQQLTKSWEKLEPHEKECLNNIYDADHSLDGRRLVLQDNDHDGIKDFRINYYGEFFENDTDADNDGLDNVLDIAPFDSERDSFEDQDQDGLANHLDWSNGDLYTKRIKSQLTQQRLHDEFGLLLVEGNQVFTPAMVQVIEDVLVRTLDSHRAAFHDKAAVKYVFSTSRPYIPAYESEYYGSVHTGTKRMYLFAAAFNTLDNEQTRIATLLTIIHEFVHGLQFTMDYPDNLHNHLKWNTDANVPNFVASLNSLGWSTDLTENIDRTEPTDRIYTGFMFNEASQVPFEQYYGKGDLRIRIGDLEKQYFSDVAPDKQYGVINSYSLGNMWEWHAEYVTASVLQRIYKATRKLLGDARYTAVHACVEDKLLTLYGEDYTYNLDKTRPDIMNSLDSLFPINDEDLAYLAEQYIVKPFQACSGA